MFFGFGFSLIYESILLGTLPIFVLSEISLFWPGKRGPPKNTKIAQVADRYAYMPFADDGVDYRKFTFILRPGEFTPDFIDKILEMPKTDIAKRQDYMRTVQNRFEISGTFEYMIRRASSVLDDVAEVY